VGFKDDIALSKADIALGGEGAGVGAVALSADLMGAGVTLGVGVLAFSADLATRDNLGVHGVAS